MGQPEPRTPSLVSAIFVIVNEVDRFIIFDFGPILVCFQRIAWIMGGGWDLAFTLNLRCKRGGVHKAQGTNHKSSIEVNGFILDKELI